MMLLITIICCPSLISVSTLASPGFLNGLQLTGIQGFISLATLGTSTFVIRSAVLLDLMCGDLLCCLIWCVVARLGEMIYTPLPGTLCLKKSRKHDSDTCWYWNQCHVALTLIGHTTPGTSSFFCIIRWAISSVSTNTSLKYLGLEIF